MSKQSDNTRWLNEFLDVYDSLVILRESIGNNSGDERKLMLKAITTYTNKRELEAELRGIDFAFDSHDYDGMRKRKEQLKQELEKL